MLRYSTEYVLIVTGRWWKHAYSQISDNNRTKAQKVPKLSKRVFEVFVKFQCKNQILKLHIMKKYLKPASRVELAQAAQMLAESLAINSGTTVDGSQALTKENDWNIWSDDEE